MTKTNTTNALAYVLFLQTPDNKWSELKSFAFFSDAEDFAGGITLGATKIIQRRTETIVVDVELK